MITRREFLKLGTVGIAGAGLSRLLETKHIDQDLSLVRVATEKVQIRKEPLSTSEVVSTRQRDEILHVYYPVVTSIGRNPVWYRTWGGYLYSGFVQPVIARVNDPLIAIPKKGCLSEVSVPYTRTFRLTRTGDWIQNYRLYYGSTHWITDILEGPDGEGWYQITDGYLRHYFGRAAHFRIFSEQELAPIHPEIPRKDKWIEVFVSEQKLIAYEFRKPVLETKISSGLPLNRPLETGELSPETPYGDFFITVKSASRHMGDKQLTDRLDSGALPGVPWVCFFDKDGYSLHGTYWHNNFGNRMSHGCVNMRTEEAYWIYRWAEPYSAPEDWELSGWGIRVRVNA